MALHVASQLFTWCYSQSAAYMDRQKIPLIWFITSCFFVCFLTVFQNHRQVQSSIPAYWPTAAGHKRYVHLQQVPAEDCSTQGTWHLLSTSDWGSSEKILPGYDEGWDYLLCLTHALPSPWVPRCCTERSQFPARRVAHPLWKAGSTRGQGGSSCIKKWAHLQARSETRGTCAESSVQPERTAALNRTPWQQGHVEVIFHVTIFQVTVSSPPLAAARDRLSEQLVNTQMAFLCSSLKPCWSEFSRPSLQLPF